MSALWGSHLNMGHASSKCRKVARGRHSPTLMAPKNFLYRMTDVSNKEQFEQVVAWAWTCFD